MSPLFLVGRESSDRRLTGAARSVLRNLLRQKRYNGARFYNYNVRNVNKKLSNRASKFAGWKRKYVYFGDNRNRTM